MVVSAAFILYQILELAKKVSGWMACLQPALEEVVGAWLAADDLLMQVREDEEARGWGGRVLVITKAFIKVKLDYNSRRYVILRALNSLDGKWSLKNEGKH